MADMNELESIVKALVEKTTSGKLSWRLSRRTNPLHSSTLPLQGQLEENPDIERALFRSDSYVARLGSGFVVISKFTPDFEPDYVSISFFNGQGNKAGDYLVEDGQPRWIELNDLINDIHKKLFGFKSLVSELVG